ATLAYFRTTWNNFRVTDNLAVGPADYDPYCITLPADSRLPNGGGNQLCGLYNITPTKFSSVNNLVVSADTFGGQSEIFNGLDLTINARLARGASVSGGVSTGRTETINCSVIDSPSAIGSGTTPNQPKDFCDVKPPFQPRIKLNGVYPMPWDM